MARLMTVLMIGDVVGEAGLRALETGLPRLIARHGADFVIVNGENAVEGYGITGPALDRIITAGADIVTSGNHVWEKGEFWEILERHTAYGEIIKGAQCLARNGHNLGCARRVLAFPQHGVGPKNAPPQINVTGPGSPLRGIENGKWIMENYRNDADSPQNPHYPLSIPHYQFPEGGNPASVPLILRPANYPSPAPGAGAALLKKNGKRLLVINLQGREYMTAIDCPFQAADAFINANPGVPAVIDFHAESSAEKEALGLYLDGRTSVVAGTHTHVQTADAKILPGGTAYITDLGMTGPTDGVIGMDAEICLARAKTQVLYRMRCADGPCAVQGIAVTFDTDGTNRGNSENNNEGGHPASSTVSASSIEAFCLNVDMNINVEMNIIEDTSINEGRL
jgi:calcineurin-like phosphoesterase